MSPQLLGLVMIAVSLTRPVTAQTLDSADRIRLAEAFTLDEHVHGLWQGWGEIPFAVLLVKPDYEYLIRHPRPTDDFTSIGYDELLKSDVLYRPRVFGTGLLATFPAVSGVPTVVIGGAEETGEESVAWVCVALHEHFHQLQYTLSGYYAELDGLDLSGGDESGMWALNYAFPYDSAPVVNALNRLGELGLRALEAGEESTFETRLNDYLGHRSTLRDILNPVDHRYLSFQLWQEGVARYTQMIVARMATHDYEPTEAFNGIAGSDPYSRYAPALERSLELELGQGVAALGRLFFYPMGALEGLLLDRANPDWRERYLEEKFDPGRYFER